MRFCCQPGAALLQAAFVARGSSPGGAGRADSVFQTPRPLTYLDTQTHVELLIGRERAAAEEPAQFQVQAWWLTRHALTRSACSAAVSGGWSPRWGSRARGGRAAHLSGWHGR